VLRGPGLTSGAAGIELIVAKLSSGTGVLLRQQLRTGTLRQSALWARTLRTLRVSPAQVKVVGHIGLGRAGEQLQELSHNAVLAGRPRLARLGHCGDSSDAVRGAHQQARSTVSKQCLTYLAPAARKPTYRAGSAQHHVKVMSKDRRELTEIKGGIEIPSWEGTR